jgi:hypothetical protein
MLKARLMIVAVLAVFAVSAVVSASASAAHQWLKNGAPLTQTEPVLSKGGQFKLVATGITITCNKVHDLGTVLPGTMDEATSIHYLECTTNLTNCDVSSVGATLGLILVNNILTELTLKENKKLEKKLVDEFKGNGVSETFVELLLESLVTNACSPLPETVKVIGTVSAEIVNATEELNFPEGESEIKGNTLEISGAKAKLFGKDTQMLTNGGTLTAL